MKQLRGTFLTLFESMIEPCLQQSILARAISAGLLDVKSINIRDFAHDKYHRVDDTPCGGGPGQLMKIDVVAKAIMFAKKDAPTAKVILTDPAAPLFSQQHAKRLSNHDHLIFVCGRYEGIDARIYHYVDEAYSVGDFVLTGGELAALAMFDAIARLVPGVLGNEESAVRESHDDGLLEYSQFTRPIEYEGNKVPDVYLSGNHKLIERERRKEQLFRTKTLRPDLFAKIALTDDDRKLLAEAEHTLYLWLGKI